MNSKKFIAENHKILQTPHAIIEPRKAESKQTGITYLSFFIFVVEK